MNEFEQKPEKKLIKRALKPKPKSPKLPIIRGKAKEVVDRELRLHKAELKRKLDENTEKMEAIKKIKKNIQKKKCCTKMNNLI